MAGNPFFSGRIPKELNEQIIKHCEKTGKSKTQVLVEALSNYLNIPIPETNHKIDNRVEKELTDLRERMQLLEETVYKTHVITDDNNNKEATLEKISKPNSIVISHENESDNKAESEIRITQKEENKTVKCLNNNDNSDDNISNHVESDFTNLETKDVVKKTGIGNSQMGRLRDKVFSEAKQQGYNIQPDIKFSSPIEAIQSRKEITIKDKKYKLFCIGIDNKVKPIWMLIPDDNISYQPDILSSTH